MNIFQAIILGIVQGLTEFLPISSTAHLLIGQKLLGIPASDAMFAFLVIIQLGTIISLIIYFKVDLWRIIRSTIQNLKGLRNFSALPFDARLGWLIILATIPALVAGLLFKDLLTVLFSNPLEEAAIRLLSITVIMVLAELIGHRTRSLESVNWLDALIIGLMQVIAVFPGASRSGTTISAGLLRNFDRPSAARFAFLMSVPVMLAAGAYETIHIFKVPGMTQLLPGLITGFIFAAVVGWFAVRWFMGYLAKNSLYRFAIYCLILGLICLGFSFT